MTENERVPVIIILHAYQPITQEKEVLERIINICYKPFFTKLLENPETKITLNVTGCLLEKMTMEYPEIIQLIEKAKDRGQIEMMGSAFYHPILPLISKEDQRYQIRKQTDSVTGIFGKTPIAFFPPELALNPENIPIIIDEGFKILISEANSLNVTYGGVYQIDSGEEIFILKRNRTISNNISFDLYKRDSEKLEKNLSQVYKMDRLPIVLAMDLETYGEHHAEYYEFFFDLTKRIKTITIPEFLSNYDIATPVDYLYQSSWSTSDEDLHNQINLPLWNHPDNTLHHLLLKHMNLLEQSKEKARGRSWIDEYHAAHYSCQLWWASGLSLEHGYISEELVLVGVNYQRLVLDTIANELEEDFKQMILKESDNIILKIEQILKEVGS